jgi:hypothetical protein
LRGKIIKFAIFDDAATMQQRFQRILIVLLACIVLFCNSQSAPTTMGVRSSTADLIYRGETTSAAVRIRSNFYLQNYWMTQVAAVEISFDHCIRRCIAIFKHGL